MSVEFKGADELPVAYEANLKQNISTQITKIGYVLWYNKAKRGKNVFVFYAICGKQLSHM